LACVPGQPRAPSPIKAVWPSLPCASPLSSASPASCIASRRRQSCRATCRCRLLTSIRRLGAQPEQNDPTKSFARTSCTQGASSLHLTPTGAPSPRAYSSRGSSYPPPAELRPHPSVSARGEYLYWLLLTSSTSCASQLNLQDAEAPPPWRNSADHHGQPSATVQNQATSPLLHHW
jgi:hypothetical protein